MSEIGQSEFQKAWQRFSRNRPALFGLAYLFLAIFLAVFGYALAPDNSPNANIQIPELALLKPGNRASILTVKLPGSEEKTTWIQTLISGKAALEKQLAIKPESLTILRDSVHFEYAGNTKRSGAEHLLSLFYPITDSIQKIEDGYVFRNGSGELKRIGFNELQTKAAAKDFVKTRNFPLGTDKYGRCMLSRLLLGFRVSLMVGLIAVAISLTLGLLLGLLGGYFGGRLDDAVMLLVNTVWSIPTLLLVFAIVLALGRGVGIIFLAVGLTMWVDVARLVRGQTLALRNQPFVEAAQSMGLSHGRILLRHIVPNLLGPVMVLAAVNFATAILIESGLSYLGFGVQPPTPSWG
ncbi:MAG: ABC transporter permease, partial [Saprospiraceae bacterium]|nr:ABC transporter permease [Saprospiraceae bacterium]